MEEDVGLDLDFGLEVEVEVELQLQLQLQLAELSMYVREEICRICPDVRHQALALRMK